MRNYISFNFLTLIFFFFQFISCTSVETFDPESESSLIRQVMARQQADWNQGNIDAFMEGYLNSEDLMFIGSGGIRKGWNNTLLRYKESYATREAMGNLTFDIIKVNVLSNRSAHLTGQYSLKNTRDSIFSQGYFTLLWEKVNGKWKIVVDQTCG